MRPVPWIVAASLLLAVLRLLAAARLDLIGDESFYVLCARHPAWAYADHPFMTALWVRTGIELAGASPLGVRLLFLVSGLLFPLAVHRLARPIVGERDAAWAAGVSLCVPILAQQGVVAVPDVPLWLFAVLALHGVERGVATGRAGAFLLAGVATALGLATHLRFALVPLAFALHAALRPEVRRAWRSPPARWALAVGALGVLPVLLHGAADGFAGLRYQLLDRHATAAGPAGWLDFVAWQSLVGGPLCFVALVWIVVRGLRSLSDRTPARALLLVFAATHLGVYFLAAPFADARHVSLHWPAPAYVSLAVLLPEVLRGRRELALAVAGSGALVVVGAFVALLVGGPGEGALRRPFAGHAGATPAVAAALVDADAPRILVTDGYRLAGRLALDLPSDGGVDLYALRNRDDVRHGRARQLDAWDRGEDALRARAGEEALLVLEKRRRTRPFRLHALSFLEAPRRVGDVSHRGFDGAVRRYLLYRGRLRAPPPQPSDRS